MKYRIALFLVLALGSRAQDDRARQFVDLLAKGEFTQAGNSLDTTMQAALPPDKLADLWHGLIAKAGAFQGQIGTHAEDVQGYHIIYVTCQFSSTKLDLKLVFDKDQHIAGLFIWPAPPDRPAAVSEADVAVKGLGGTLALPAKGAGPFPAVVLVHGSGTSDRDETVAANKPFRDLAWGLASRGIAVLRYDKRKDFPKNATVKEETIDDAVAAVSLLRKTENIDAANVFVIGHSLGGMLIPRIAKADSSIRGLVSMAGTTRPPEDILVEQLEYLGSPDVEKARTEAARIKSLKEGDPPALGVSPKYWLDLRGYDPPNAAKDMKQPFLILQGERDYQVTMKDFDNWKRALGSKPNVTFHSYAKLNHLFLPGEGKSKPEEYALPGRIPDEVIDDIANWIKANSLKSP